MKAITILVVTSCAVFLAACGASGFSLATLNTAMQASAVKYGGEGPQQIANAQSVSIEGRNTPVCPVTKPIEPLFIPPDPYPPVAPYGGFWYGSDSLWTMIYADGQWSALPSDGGSLSNKVFWWYPGFDGTRENFPKFKITGKQLDGEGTFATLGATNAYHEDFGGWTILTGVEIPWMGCWAITGEYEGESLTFVVQVGD